MSFLDHSSRLLQPPKQLHTDVPSSDLVRRLQQIMRHIAFIAVTPSVFAPDASPSVSRSSEPAVKQQPDQFTKKNGQPYRPQEQSTFSPLSVVQLRPLPPNVKYMRFPERPIEPQVFPDEDGNEKTP